MKTDKMADLGSLHTFVYACPLLFLNGINKVFVFFISIFAYAKIGCGSAWSNEKTSFSFVSALTFRYLCYTKIG